MINHKKNIKQTEQPSSASSAEGPYGSSREKFLALSLESTRKSYYPQLQVQLETARKNENRLQLLIDNLPARIAYVNSQEVYVLINHEYEKAFGLNREQIIGRSVKSIFGNENYEKVRRYIHKALEGEASHFEISFSDTTGRVLWLNFNYVPEIDHQGIVHGFYDLTMDQTEKKQAEQEKQNLEARLQQTQKMEALGTLAGGIAHDFNNILFPIVGMAELLLEDLPRNSLEHENAQEILKAGKRGSDLVKQILVFNRQSRNKLIPVRIQEVLAEAMKLMRSTIPSYIEIVEDIQPDCGMLMADPTKMHQVAMNIITNAYHALESKGGKITVSLKEVDLEAEEFTDDLSGSGRYALFSVTDTGHGISPELMGKIFEPYFTTKDHGKGTGLGLAVVYGIIKEHKGDVRVYSEVGKGTVFHVYLPLMDKTVITTADKKAGSEPEGNERILLVDDEKPIARLEQQQLERLGYTVTACISSVEALETFKGSPDAFDLVITDMAMPSMRGDQLARELNAIRPDIPVIICSGFGGTIKDDNAGINGVKGFLMKPVVKSEMARTVRNVLDQAKNSSIDSHQ